MSGATLWRTTDGRKSKRRRANDYIGVLKAKPMRNTPGRTTTQKGKPTSKSTSNRPACLLTHHQAVLLLDYHTPKATRFLMNNNDIKTVTLTINSEQAQRKLDDINRRLEQARLKRQDAFDRGDDKALQAYTNNTTD